MVTTKQKTIINPENHTHIHKHGDISDKANKLTNMATGSLLKVSAMIQDQRYCPEVIQQIDSVVGLLHSVKKELLKDHLDSCLVERLKTDKDSTIKELMKIYNLKQ